VLEGFDLTGDGTRTTVWTGNPVNDRGHRPQDVTFSFFRMDEQTLGARLSVGGQAEHDLVQ
jgi:hypothetical protein